MIPHGTATPRKMVMISHASFCRAPQPIRVRNSCFVYSVSQKKSPWGFLTDIFPNRLGIFSSNFTRLLYVPIYARLKIYIQLLAIFGEIMRY